MLKKSFILLMIAFLLVGCSNEKDDSIDMNDKVFYKNYSDILDFGHLSGIEPEVHFEEIDDSTTYIYFKEKELDKNIYSEFAQNLKDKGYKYISETRISDDGGEYEVLEKDNTQIMYGAYSDKILISLRPKFPSYKNFPNIPDFGRVMNVEADEEDVSSDGVHVFVYPSFNQPELYAVALKKYGFEKVRDRLKHNDGYLYMYSNDEHVLILGTYPDYLSIAIGEDTLE